MAEGNNREDQSRHESGEFARSVSGSGGATDESPRRPEESTSEHQGRLMLMLKMTSTACVIDELTAAYRKSSHAIKRITGHGFERYRDSSGKKVAAAKKLKSLARQTLSSKDELQKLIDIHKVMV